eukprot:4714363-Pleurochrysis_carterae.AAC.1
MACVLAERSRSASVFFAPCAHGRRRPAAPPHRSHRAGELAPRLHRSPRPLVVSIITSNQFPPESRIVAP